jgi:nitrous oxidase accessory protein
MEIPVDPGTDLGALVADLPEGSSIVLRTGVHQGPLHLPRTLHVRGEPGAVITGGGTGSVVVVDGPRSSVRDLRITAGGHLPQQDDAGLVVHADRVVVEHVSVDHAYLGIDLRGASDGAVRNCTVEGDPTEPFGLRGDGIRLWESDRNTVTDNVLRDVRDLVVWYSDDNVLTGNRVTGSRYGTHLMHTTGNTVADNWLEDDVVGVFVMYSDDVALTGNTVTGALGAAGVGFGFKESDGIAVSGNRIVANSTAIYLDNTPHRLGSAARFEANLFAANGVGVRFHSSQGGASFSGNGFVGNATAVAVDGGGDASGTAFTGNAWTEYAGYDLDLDGYGDLPFELRSAAGQLRDRRPILAYFGATPAAALLELFASAFPLFAPRPLLRDARPAMQWSGP